MRPNKPTNERPDSGVSKRFCTTEKMGGEDKTKEGEEEKEDPEVTALKQTLGPDKGQAIEIVCQEKHCYQKKINDREGQPSYTHVVTL